MAGAVNFGKQVYGETSNANPKNVGPSLSPGGGIYYYKADSWSVSGINAGDFSIVSADTSMHSDGSLYNGAFAKVTFHPTGLGPRSATVEMHWSSYDYHYENGEIKFDPHDSGVETVTVTGTGVMHDPRPGSRLGLSSKFCMGSDESPRPVKGDIDIGTQNARFASLDPVRTRGYPLVCDIFINTQDPGLFSSLMGNAVFTYGIAVKNVSSSTYPSYDDRWIVRDGDGTYLDFGPSSGPPKGSQGIFSHLVKNADGTFILYDAGPPAKLGSYGNYVYYFDVTGRLEKLHDGAGNWQVLSYVGSQLSRVDDLSSKKAITFTYTSGRISAIRQNGLTYQTRLTYSNGRLSLIEVLNANGTVATKTNFSYSNSMLSQVMRDGDAATAANISYTSFQTLNSSSGLKRANVSTGLFSSNITTVAENGSQGAVRIDSADSLGRITSYRVAASGEILSITPPLYTGSNSPTKVQLGYDASKNVSSIVGPGVNRTFTYDAHGQVTRAYDGAGGYIGYDYHGADLVRVFDAVGSLLWVYYEDPRFPHVPTRFANADAESWSRTLNPFGQETLLTPPAGSAIGSMSTAYQESTSSGQYGWPTSIEGNGMATSFESYTAMGDVGKAITRVNTGLSVAEYLTYDGAQRVTELKHADGTAFHWLYSGRKLASTTDEAGIVTNFDWCSACGHLMAVRGPLGWKNSRTQDADRNTTGFVDSRNNTTQFDHGANGELIKLTYPDTSFLEYQYSAGGQLRQFKNGRGQITNYTYDLAGRTKSRLGPSINEQYTYNTDGSLKQVDAPNYICSYTYTRDRRVFEASMTMRGSYSSPVQKLIYTYFPDGRLATLTWRNAGVEVCKWLYAYGTGGRVSSVSNSFGQTTTYSYDDQGKVLGQTNSNNTWVNYTYNNKRGWVQGVSQKSNGADLATYSLQYDGGLARVPVLTAVSEGSGAQTAYQYDTLYRLTSANRTGVGSYSETHAYDLTGNLRSVSGQVFGTYDAANKMLTSPLGAIGHDADGNTQYLGSWSNAMFTWNVDSKMMSQRTGLSNLKSYDYDYAGRRIVSQAVGYAPKFYVFSGNALIGEVVNGQATAIYTWGADGLVSQAVREAGVLKHYWYHFGPQGETRQLTNAAGQVAASYLYKPYGQAISATGSVPNAFRFGGRYGYYTDGPNDLVLCGQRWYSPTLRRWLSRDPIGYGGGENLYLYCAGDPVGRYDNGGSDSKPTLIFWPAHYDSKGEFAIGHIGLQLDDNTYITNFPVHHSGAIGYTPMREPSFNQDQADEEIEPLRLEVDGLDVAKAKAWWDDYRKSGKLYQGATNNCADTVTAALRAGGLWVPEAPVSAPWNVYYDRAAIQAAKKLFR